MNKPVNVAIDCDGCITDMHISNKPLVIIVEGVDRTGKSTFIEKLRNKATTHKIVHLHSVKPPQLKWSPYNNINGEKSREWSYNYNMQTMANVNELIKDNDIIILDRSYIGEYVYGDLYRNAKYRNASLGEFEDRVSSTYPLLKIEDFVLVYLTDSVENILAREDGKSHTNDAEYKLRELRKFKEAVSNSKIENKVYINWAKTPFTDNTFDKYINYILSDYDKQYI